MGFDVSRWGELAHVSLVVEYNKPAVISPGLRECSAIVYRSIRAAFPCLCVFGEHRLCFLSIYSPPPPFLQLNHVTLDTEGDLLLTASHAEWNWSETLSELQILRPLPGFLVFMLSLENKMYEFSCSILCSDVLPFALLQWRFFLSVLLGKMLCFEWNLTGGFVVCRCFGNHQGSTHLYI